VFDVQHSCTSMMDTEMVKIPIETSMAPTVLFWTGCSHNMPYTKSTLLQVYQEGLWYKHPCVMKKSSVFCHWSVTVLDSEISGTHFGRWRVLSSEMWCVVVWYKFFKALKERAASFYSVKLWGRVKWKP